MNIKRKQSTGGGPGKGYPPANSLSDQAGRDGAVALLRLCTTLLAVVSFWATAQGMEAFVFSQRWQAYAASLAVQGILLGLNFYLPGFWRAAKGTAVRVLLLGLSCVVLFCSSWFSFVYIVGRVYGDSWDMERQLLVQSAYRRAVYDGGDYAREYQEVLNEDLRQRIVSLSNQARGLGDQTVDVGGTYDWEAERGTYTAEDFSARSPMRTAIDAMERAMAEGASAAMREQAADVLISMRDVLEDEIESLTAQIGSTNNAVATANRNIQSAQNRVVNAPAGTDLTGLINQVDRAADYAEGLQATLQQQQDRLEDYREALSQVRLYQAALGHAGGGPGNLVSASLRNIQQELFRDEPDLVRLETLALDVFHQLQTAMDAGVEGSSDQGEEAPGQEEEPPSEGDAPSDEKDDGSEEEAQDTYQQLLIDTDNFIRELRNYQALKSASTRFDAMLEELRTDSGTQLSSAVPSGEAEAGSPAGPEEGGAPEGEAEAGSPSGPEDGDAPEGEAESGASEMAGVLSGAAPVEWREKWLARLDDLKSLISGLPAYSGTENRVLRAYSRAEAAGALDEAIRKYIADHNAVQQGLIYLGSPYRGVAVFSLLLAFFLDIAAFVTGLVIDIVERKREEEEKDPGDGAAAGPRNEPDPDPWEPSVGLNRYIYLSGNLHRENWRTSYQGIEDGAEVWIELNSVKSAPENVEKDFLGGKPGLYLRRGDALFAVKPQELAFLNGEGGPRDGVYFDCVLRYDEGLLSIQAKGEEKLRNLANVEENLMVYQLSEGGCEIFPVKYLESRIWKTAVAALNRRGTAVAAIYLL